MKLFVKEKLMSLHNKYGIFDEGGNQIYEFSSEIFTLGDKTRIFDMGGNELAYIEQELFHFMPHYNIFIGGNAYCSIAKKFAFLKNDYELSNGYKVEGSFTAFSFSVLNERGKVAADIKRGILTLGDKYEINIYDDSLVMQILTIIVAITNDIDRAQEAAAS